MVRVIEVDVREPVCFGRPLGEFEGARLGFNPSYGLRLSSIPNTFQKRPPGLPAAPAPRRRAHVAQTIREHLRATRTA